VRAPQVTVAANSTANAEHKHCASTIIALTISLLLKQVSHEYIDFKAMITIQYHKRFVKKFSEQYLK
jgi:hypothetical protein